jgi:hypothetical protein
MALEKAEEGKIEKVGHPGSPKCRMDASTWDALYGASF